MPDPQVPTTSKLVAASARKAVRAVHWAHAEDILKGCGSIRISILSTSYLFCLIGKKQ